MLLKTIAMLVLAVFGLLDALAIVPVFIARMNDALVDRL